MRYLVLNSEILDLSDLPILVERHELHFLTRFYLNNNLAIKITLGYTKEDKAYSVEVIKKENLLNALECFILDFREGQKLISFLGTLHNGGIEA